MDNANTNSNKLNIPSVFCLFQFLCHIFQLFILGVLHISTYIQVCSSTLFAMVKIIMNLTYPHFECFVQISVDLQTYWFYDYGKQIQNGTRSQNDS